MIKDNAELIAWIHSQLEIARNRTYPYSAEFLLLQNQDDNKLVKVQVTNFSATDNKTHIYICLKPSDSFIYQKIQPIPLSQILLVYVTRLLQTYNYMV